MQGKMGPDDVDIVLLFQSLNTPGTEITPGSHIVGENF
jgi:hypothetical protein